MSPAEQFSGENREQRDENEEDADEEDGAVVHALSVRHGSEEVVKTRLRTALGRGIEPLGRLPRPKIVRARRVL